MRNVIHRKKVVFPFEKLGTDFEDGAMNVYNKYAAGTATYVNIDPSPSVLLGQINDFVTASQLTTSNKGAIPAREAKREILWGGLEGVRNGVQKLCDAHPDQAAVLAGNAGMRLYEPNPPVPVILTGKLTNTKGEVRLKASLALLVAMLPPVKGQGGKKTILWRYTPDAGKTWILTDTTPFVTTQIDGLPLNTDVGFQVALKDRRGTTAWSQTFTLYVH